MSLRDAVLAALLEGESSGYDLAKGFDASVANFWMATPQQLYRELDRLAEQGLIQARVVHQERRPNKRMYSLTEAGRDAIQQFTARAPKPSVIRDELMVKVRPPMPVTRRPSANSSSNDCNGPPPNCNATNGFGLVCSTAAAEEEYLAQAERVGPYLTLLRGIAFEQENIRWAEHALTIIERRLVTQA